MQKWEYKVIQIKNIVKAGFGRMNASGMSFKSAEIQSIIQKYGYEGWELVEVLPSLTSQGTGDKLLVFFKRKINE